MAQKIKAYGICIYKITNNKCEILLCKSINSQTKWGFLKGVELEYETKEQTAIREFYEESSILVKQSSLEEYFFQENETKDIGIFLVNYRNIKNIDNYFNNNILKEEYLNKENSKVMFYSINKQLPIKKKQIKIYQKITNFLKNKYKI
jgi:8-oxo-dGTP pyrophosphatase MutT (NUDIX family)